MSYNTQLTLRAEPKDKVVIVNLEFATNMHYVLYSSPQLDSVHCKRGILLVNTQRSIYNFLSVYDNPHLLYRNGSEVKNINN